MNNLVFFLEETSAREMLKGLLPRLLPDSISPTYVVFEGKQDLEKRLPRKLRSWLDPRADFIVLRDKDGADCKAVKQNLRKICTDAGKPETVIRIACTELESWYLGDLQAVESAFAINGLAKMQNKKKFRNPDNLANAAEEMKKITNKKYQKISGSRAMGPKLGINDNQSGSFNVFLRSIDSIKTRMEL